MNITTNEMTVDNARESQESEAAGAEGLHVDTASGRVAVGGRVYYTGDMANPSGWGTVSRIEPSNYYGYTIYLKMDDTEVFGDREKSLTPSSFSKSPGQRFKTEAQYSGEQAAALEAFRAQAARFSQVHPVPEQPPAVVGESVQEQGIEVSPAADKKAHQAERLSAYLAKREARVERMLARADRREKEGQARLAVADRIASFIPFGQPILVGHHSEKRHRRDLDKIHRNTDKGFASLQEAKRLRAKALSVEENAAIFSDDPAATEKLETKIERLEKRQALMKAVNTRIRAGASFQDLGFSEDQEKALKSPSRFGGAGFPGYKLTNNSANIRRLKARLQDLRKREDREAPEDTVINGTRIVQNLDDNRVQMVFPGKPSESMRDRLKKSGFRWSPFNGCWQRHLSAYAVQLAKELAGMGANSSGEG